MFAYDMLNLIRTFKTFINKYDETILNPTRRRVYFNDGEILRNFHYINTLETFKLSLCEKIEQPVHQNYLLNDSIHADWNKNAEYFLFLIKKYKSQLKKYLLENGYPKTGPVENKNNEHDLSGSSKHKISEDWKFVATILDKFFFYFFALTVPVSILAMTLKIALYNN
jgi:hypothetical protein